MNPEHHRGYIPISELKEYPYNTDCVNCVVTTDLRMRGHDVTACSTKECDLRQKSDLIWTGSDARKQSALKDPDAIINAVKNSENGARFFLGVHDNEFDKTGHAMMAVNVDGRFELLDPQVAARYNEVKARNRLSGLVEYFRIDDLELEQRAYTAAKKRVKK